ncbi:hypothetical protein SNOG_16290 [Parastagonospora nodorum SN15]|uniref:Uncharacterized protein n=1 Tax=Phaeosphaeria nodorum (strain SN15 / ATCC MYA-4574 / FGSC 10173) TaxID=321614 RepID=Q0TVX9_PHANO|nr:hypothetical protein SNOG_16290 [Parastagonospora nodorum SN15]EAT76276.1 hypothetical protein SNOG_16290 [Parastagonospora nodorum SN15]
MVREQRPSYERERTTIQRFVAHGPLGLEDLQYSTLDQGPMVFANKFAGANMQRQDFMDS